jgi:hypothetical protein
MEMKPSRSFASDNSSGVHPEILSAIARVNSGHVPGYGEDPYTDEAIAKFRAIFGPDTDVFFVFGGTGANVLSLASALKPYEAVICTSVAHINVDECGAPEKFSGCKLLSVSTSNGKLTIEGIKKLGNKLLEKAIDESTSEIVKWNVKDLKVIDRIPTYYSIGHLCVPGGPTKKPWGKYVIAYNKITKDRYLPTGPELTQSAQLYDISGEKMKLILDFRKKKLDNVRAYIKAVSNS